MSDRKKALNWEQVRARIESGATGDKVAGSDPAAAPIGTDDEAAAVPSETTEEAGRKRCHPLNRRAAVQRITPGRQQRDQPAKGAAAANNPSTSKVCSR